MNLPKVNIKHWACVGGVALIAGAYAMPSFNPVQPAEPLLQPPANEQTTVAEPPPKSEQNRHSIQKHTVAAGETLLGIAERYGVDLDTLTAANSGLSELIHPGDELIILPKKGIIHNVDTGDTLWDIAHTYGIQLETIKSANNKATDELVPGEKLFIPGARWARADTAVARGASVARFTWPTKGEFSSPFGWRWGRLHAGVDIANDIGTHVMAARAGQVIWAGWRGGYGYAVMIDHGGGYVSLYGHLDDFFVERGQFVRAGQRIASMGNTGNSTGPHLHFEIQKDGQPIDPMAMLP